MAITFPTDPAGQSPANTFSPSSTPVANSANGNTYIWNGTAWVAQSTNSGSYVETGGDTMTGPLRFAGSTSGYAELRAEPNAGEAVFTFPTTGGVLATTTSGSGGDGDSSGSGADAWGTVNADGTKGAPGLNYTSAKNGGTGLYRVTFDTPMPNDQYSVQLTGTSGAVPAGIAIQATRADGFDYVTYNSSTGAVADKAASFAVFATNALPPSGTTGTDAWVQVAGGSGANIEASYNIASVENPSAGVYEVTFVTPMPTTNYSAVATCTSSTDRIATVTGRTTTGFGVRTVRNDTRALYNSGFSVVVNATNAQLPNTVTQEQIEAAINNPGVSAWGNITNTGQLAGGLNCTAAISSDGFGFDVTFDTPMPNANYAITACGSFRNQQVTNPVYRNVTPNGFTLYLMNKTGTAQLAAGTFAVFATNALPPRGTTGADAWGTVNSDGTKDSSGFNVASTTRTSQGIYDIVFTNPMPDNKYCVQATIDGLSDDWGVTPVIVNQTTTGFTARLSAPANGDLFDRGFGFTVHATNAQLPDTVTQEQIDQAVSGRYQQGTWTPTALQGVQIVSNFEWSRIGNQVTISGALAGIATGNAGAFIVQGIPYANKMSGCKGACMSQGFTSPPTAIYITQGGNQCEFYQSTSSTWVQATYNMLVAAGAVYFTATYSTDDTTWVPINGATVD